MAKEFIYREVESSNIAKVGYNAEDQLLEITFQSYEVYWYLGVSRDVVDNLCTAESIGKYFNTHIKKGAYPFMKVSGLTPDIVMDAVLIANTKHFGTKHYRKFSQLCEIMDWDFIDTWDMALHRNIWFDYQDDEYLAKVQELANDTLVLNAPEKWPEIVRHLKAGGII